MLAATGEKCFIKTFTAKNLDLNKVKKGKKKSKLIPINFERVEESKEDNLKGKSPDCNCSIF